VGEGALLDDGTALLGDRSVGISKGGLMVICNNVLGRDVGLMSAIPLPLSILVGWDWSVTMERQE